MIDKSWETIKKFNEKDVIEFAKLTGDNNRIHTDLDYAKNSIFGGTVVHGIFVASLFSKIFGKIFPGEGSIYLKQDLKFVAPVFVGDKIIARVTLKEFKQKNFNGIFKCICLNQNDEEVVLGSALIKFPKDFIYN